MKTRLLVAVTLAVVAAAGFVLWPASTQKTVPAPVAPATVAVAPGVPAAAQAQPCHLDVGTRLSWTASLQASTLQQGPKGLAEVAMALNGTFDAEVVSARPSSSVLVARFELSAPPGKPSLDVVSLRQPFLLEVDRQCALTQFARRQDTSNAVARNQQSLAWEAQARLAPGELVFEDSSGIAQARLEAVPNGVRRTLERYRSVWPGEPEDLTLTGAMVASLEDGRWFSSLESRRELRGTGVSTSSHWSLASRAPTAEFTAAERDEAQYVWGSLFARAEKPQLVSRPVTARDLEVRASVAGLSTTQALDAFADRVKKGVGTQSTWPELSAWFEVHPEEIQPAIDRYLEGALPPNGAGDFFLALSKARTPEARDALLAIKRNDGAVMMDQVRSMFALVTREDVGQPLAEELAADVRKQVSRGNHDSEFLASEAMLALSVMSGLRAHLGIGQVAQSAQRQALQSQGSQLAKTALRAVGNSGDPAMLPELSPFMSSSDVSTRKAAAHAFSRMPPDATDALELEWLRRETSPFVKKELYRVLQQQHVDMNQGASRPLVEQAISELRTTKSAYTRKYMVLLISQSAVADAPDIRRALVEQAKWERARHTPLFNAFGKILTPAERLEVLQ